MDTKSTKEPVYSKHAGRYEKGWPHTAFGNSAGFEEYVIMTNWQNREVYSQSVLVWRIPTVVFLFNQFNSVYQIRSKVTHKRLIVVRVSCHIATFIPNLAYNLICRLNKVTCPIARGK